MTTHLDRVDIIDFALASPPRIVLRTRCGGTPSAPQPHDSAVYPAQGETIQDLHARLSRELSDPCPDCGKDPCEC